MHAPEFMCSFLLASKSVRHSSQQAGLGTYNIRVEIPCLFLLWQGSFQQQSCGLILFGGHPDDFIKALNEVLLLRAAFIRPCHPKDCQGPEANKGQPQARAEVPGKLTIRIDLKRMRTFQLTWSTQDPLWNKHTSKCLSKRQIKMSQRHTTP